MWSFLSSKEEKADKNPASVKAELEALGLDVDTSFMEQPDDIPQYDGV